MSRRALDQYFTPAEAVRDLLRFVKIPKGARIVEPCAGDGAISNALKAHGHRVRTNDVDARFGCDTTGRAQDLALADDEWIVTNPPFSEAMTILRYCWANGGPCCFLLRLSFLEPTIKDKPPRNIPRGPWLEANPPDGVIVLPRISFTGDGHTDSVTCAWICWGVEPFGVRVVNSGAMKSSAEAA